MSERRLWSGVDDRLLCFADAYRLLRDAGLKAEPNHRTATLRRLRKTRKRLKRIGYRIKEAADGCVTLRRRKLRSGYESHETAIARGIEYFIVNNQLIYGNKNRERPSWSLALSTLTLDGPTAKYLDERLPVLIDEFARFSRLIIGECVAGLRPDLPLLRGVPDEMLALWRLELSRKDGLPFCFRPDLVITPTGDIRIIEFNVDSRLDLGIAHGVTQYSIPLVGDAERLISNRLVQDYAEAAKSALDHSPSIAVTVTGVSGRKEYRAELDYFCKALSLESSVPWVVRDLTDIIFNEHTSCLHDRLTGKKIGLVRLEFDILDQFGQIHQQEANFAGMLLQKKETPFIGTLLPYADKLLIAAVLSSDQTSAELKAALCPSWIFSPDQYGALLAARTEGRHMVLKKCGIFADTTGSKGVIISSDVSEDAWCAALDTANVDWHDGRAAWVIQPRLEPKVFSIRFRRRVGSDTKLADCFVRLSPFFTRQECQSEGWGFRLSGAVATAGTDTETLNNRRYMIRALREATYLAVTSLVD